MTDPRTTLPSLSDADLASASGGVSMQLTQYGYPNDPYGDSDTRRGLGAYHHLERGRSIALTDSGLASLGLTHAQVRSGTHWVDIHLEGGGTLHRAIDDRAPEGNRRVDMYQPGGFDKRLPGHADVTLSR